MANTVQIAITGDDRLSQVFRQVAQAGETAFNNVRDSLNRLETSGNTVANNIQSSLRGIQAPNLALQMTTNIDQIQSQLRGLQPPNIDLQINSNVQRVENQIHQLATDAPTVEIQVDANTSQARSQIQRLSDMAQNIDLKGLGFAAAGKVATDSIANANQAMRDINATTAVTAEQAKKLGDVAVSVYKNNFGENLASVSATVVGVNQTLGLQGDELKRVTEGVVAITDSFGSQGAEVNNVMRAVLAMKTSFPGMTEQQALDTIAAGFRNGLGASQDYLDTLIEYPGQFASMGMSADQMNAILIGGMKNGIMNTDMMADAFKEMGIRILDNTSKGDKGFKELAASTGMSQTQIKALTDGITAGGPKASESVMKIVQSIMAIKDPVAQQTAGVEVFGTKWEDWKGKVGNAIVGANGNMVSHEGAIDALNAKYGGMGTTLEGWKRQFETSVIGSLGELGPVAGSAIEVAGNVGTAIMGLKALGLSFSLTGITTAFTSLAGVLSGAVTAAIGGVQAALAFLAANPIVLVVIAVVALVAIIIYNWDTIKEYTIKAFSAISDFLGKTWDWIKDVFGKAWAWISDITTKALDVMYNLFLNWTIPGLIIKHWETIKNIFTVGWMFVKELCKAALDLIVGFILNWTLPGLIIKHWDTIKKTFTEGWDKVKEFTSKAFDFMKELVMKWTLPGLIYKHWDDIKNKTQEIWNTITGWLSEKWNAIKTTVTNVWEGISSTLSNVWEGIKSKASTVWEGIKSVAMAPINALRDSLSGVWEGIKTSTSNTWEGIKNAIMTPINSAKDLVGNAINAMKNFFNFSWSLPSIKLPHFSMSGSFGINPPSVPSFGVNWYKTGGVFTKPVLAGFGDVNEAIVPFSGPHANRIASLIADNMPSGNNGSGSGEIIIQNLVIQANNEQQGVEAGKAFISTISKYGIRTRGV